jgi:hypothetical protein
VPDVFGFAAAFAVAGGTRSSMNRIAASGVLAI